MQLHRLPTVLFALLIIGGCASIPQESPELSHEIGQRVTSMRTAHLNLVHEYFDLKKQQVNRIFEEEWIPSYAERFFAQDRVADYWDRLVSEADAEERLQFLTQLGPKMLEEIRSRRAAYLEPLNQLESDIVSSLKDDYRQILSANNTLTSFLTSSSKVTQNRERYLEYFGVEQQKIESTIDQIDRRSAEIMDDIRKANVNSI